MIRGGCERTQVPKRNPFFPGEEKFDDDLRRMSPISSEEERVGLRGKKEKKRHQDIFLTCCFTGMEFDTSRKDNSNSLKVSLLITCK